MNNFLLFFNISGGEILVVVVVAYLVFGPKKIPELARMVGKGINELRRATDDIKREINREANKIKEDINIDIEDPTDFKKASASKPGNTKDNQPQEEPKKEANKEKKTNSDSQQ